MKWILRYLRGTADVGLVYGKNLNPANSVVGFVDSDYAGDFNKKEISDGLCLYALWLCR